MPVVPLSDYSYNRTIGPIVSTVSRIDFSPSNFDFSKTKFDGSDLRVYDVTADAFVPVWTMDYSPTTKSGSLWFKANNTTNPLKLYYGNPAATPVSSHSAVFTGGTDFGADLGDLTSGLSGSGAISIIPASSGATDSRNFAVWNLAENPVLKYSDTGFSDGSYSGVRECTLVRDSATNLPIQIGGQYYITFARRTPVVTDKMDSVIAHGPTVNGPWTGFTKFYSAPGSIRLCYPSTVIKVGSTYVCYLTYGWDTGGSSSPGLAVYVLTSSDLSGWSSATKIVDPSIWTDPRTGNHCTDAGNPWVIKCSDGQYFMVVEAEDSASGLSWLCYGATTSDPISGTWTAVNSGGPLVTDGSTGAWDANAVANPKVMQLPDLTYVLQYNGFSDNVVGNGQHGFATSSTRGGPYTKISGNPTAGRFVQSYGFETSAFHLDTDGSTIFNWGQRFGDSGTGSSQAKIFLLGALLKPGGLFISPAVTDSAFVGKVIGSGTITAESRSVFTAHRATNATPFLLALHDFASVPSAATWSASSNLDLVNIIRWSHDFVPSSSAGPGDISFYYVDGSNVRHWWNGAAWTTSATGRNLSCDHAREVLAQISDDGTNYVLSVTYVDDGSSVASASIAKSSVKSFASGSRCLIAGDPSNAGWGSGTFFRFIQTRPYVASDPVVTISLESGSTGGTGNFRLLESGFTRLLENLSSRLLETAPTGAPVGPATGARLLESGFFRLTEAGDYRLTEYVDLVTPPPTSPGGGDTHSFCGGHSLGIRTSSVAVFVGGGIY